MWGCSTRAYRLCRNGSTSSKRNLRKRKRENNPQRGNGDVRYQFAQQAPLARADEVINRDLVAAIAHSRFWRNCRAGGADQCLKSGVKRTQRGHAATAESDPQETCAAQDFRTAKALFVPSLKRGIIPPLHE